MAFYLDVLGFKESLVNDEQGQSHGRLAHQQQSYQVLLQHLRHKQGGKHSSFGYDDT